MRRYDVWVKIICLSFETLSIDLNDPFYCNEEDDNNNDVFEDELVEKNYKKRSKMI